MPKSTNKTVICGPPPSSNSLENVCTFKREDKTSPAKNSLPVSMKNLPNSCLVFSFISPALKQI